MALLLIIFNVVAPVFLIAGSGYLWVKRGVEYPTEFVTRLATNIAIPCLVFDSLVNTDIDPEALATMFWASLATYGGAMVAVYIFVKLARLDMPSYFAPFVSGIQATWDCHCVFLPLGRRGLAMRLFCSV